MPGTMIELHGSRTFNVSVTGGSAKFLYYLHGESDEATAYDLVLSTSPATWFDYTRAEIDMSNRPTLDQWFPVVNYSLPVFPPGGTLPGGVTGEIAGTDTAPATSPSSSPPAPGEVLSGLSFTVSTEQQHVQRSLETISKTGLTVGGVTATPPDLKGLIGVTSDKKIEGVDIPVSIATITMKRTIPPITAGYFRNLLYLCGKTNANQWWIFNYEEGLFNGCNGQMKDSGEFDCNFEFKFQATKTDIYIREGLIVPEKKGWNHLWTMNRLEKDGTANEMVERPYAAYVERIIDTVDFTWLGI
jgi:hypothetical protein